MDYKRIYDEIIANRKANPISGYVEKHHILPRSLGGDDAPDNIVTLTAREHYICHLLLTKIYKHHQQSYHKMIRAWMMMANANSNTQQRDYKINSRLYESLRTEFSQVISDNQTGSKNSQYGSKWYHNVELRETRKFKPDDVPVGWVVGRVVNWEFLNQCCVKCGINLNLTSPKQMDTKYCAHCRAIERSAWSIAVNNSRTKACIINGVQYNGVSHAAECLNIPCSTISYRLNSDSYVDYFFV